MKKMVVFLSALMLGSQVLAAAQDSNEAAVHTVTLKGLAKGEGRYIRSDVYENNRFLSGYFFCAKNEETLYNMEYVFNRDSVRNQAPFHVTHFTRFSICQDDTLAHCQEFATDTYHTFADIDGHLYHDVNKTTVDISPVKELYHSCEPNEAMDEMVQKAIHLNDRRFARVG